MWLENAIAKSMICFACVCFNPSSNGCGWKTVAVAKLEGVKFEVSILLLMDVAGKPVGQLLDMECATGFQSFF